MQKILLVLQREYLVRVRKKTFLLMTFLTPLLFAALFFIPILFIGLEESKVVDVVDESGKFEGKLKNSDKLQYDFQKADLTIAKKNLQTNKHYAILYIPKIDLDNPVGIRVWSKGSISFDIEQQIKAEVDNVIEDMKLIRSGLDKEIIEKIKSDVFLDTKDVNSEAQTSSAVAYIIGILVAMLIYMSVFLYGQQVMRSVIEEKTSRIIEVIICSVKPFQLMMGKILGVAGVGLTQFILWILLTIGIVYGATQVMDVDKYLQQEVAQNTEQLGKNSDMSKASKVVQGNGQLEKMYASLKNVPYTKIILCFFFYFLGGYLLYSAMFAAVASAVDNETDVQQFVLPISLPIIIAFIGFQAVLRTPDGSLAFWMSIIPFTSPIIMMVRLPFEGVQTWELVLSMALLVFTFVSMTWVASRIYRIGILMYGNKPKFKDLAKWIFYKM
jgi:ABC-2 type transport system permease protein